MNHRKIPRQSLRSFLPPFRKGGGEPMASGGFSVVEERTGLKP